MLRFYSADAVHAALDFPALADALAEAFAQGAQVPLRHGHVLGGDDRLLLMPAWSATALGTKLVTVMPGNAARGARTVHALYVLCDRVTGEPCAVLDGEALTLRRTAAASALAARHLVRADADTLLVVGTGALAPFMALAHWALRPTLQRVLVWGRDEARADALVRTLAGAGLPALRAASLESAVRGAAIVTCATTSREPLVQGAWLAPGAHVDLVGGFTPQMRETDDAAVRAARLYVDTYSGALVEAGDLVQPLKQGVIERTDVVAELAELVRGERPGRATAEEITLFKSVGTALEDLAAAQLVVARSGAA
jgi:ornithine cyclodeaminase